MTRPKNEYYNELKADGFEFEKIYRDYTQAELRELHRQFYSGQHSLANEEDDQPAQEQPLDWAGEPVSEPTPVAAEQPPAPAPSAAPAIPVPNELAGSAGLQPLERGEEVVEVDEEGREWLQLEVRKPAFPKPRGRRVVQYVDSGSRVQQVQDGDYVESFEVPGNARTANEVKITLPSHQVGIFRDKRFPFKIYTYNSNNGFDYEEVNAYYGGSELVPETVKRKYVSNRLCYDIRSVINAIRDEHRQLQLRRG